MKLIVSRQPQQGSEATTDLRSRSNNQGQAHDVLRRPTSLSFPPYSCPRRAEGPTSAKVPVASSPGRQILVSKGRSARKNRGEVNDPRFRLTDREVQEEQGRSHCNGDTSRTKKSREVNQQRRQKCGSATRNSIVDQARLGECKL